MPSTLTWIDHDPAARDRALRILSLFQEKESRDELGLGAIRDSFSDALFPGTSTIQTRLRYMLFVPWIYRTLEEWRVPSPRFAKEARQMEVALMEPLLESGDRAGVFGRVAGRGLKRLPSSVYWSGLETWGIRLVSCSQDEYHRHVNEIYRRWDIVRNRYEKVDPPESEILTWHPRLPDTPKGFPDKIENLSVNLEPDEASFLLDRIMKSQKESLLAHLALHCKPAECDFPWVHPDRAKFSDEHKELLKFAEFFSTVMHGATFLYNLMLAEQSGRKGREEEHLNNLDEWKDRLGALRHVDLPLEGLWGLTAGRGHTITGRTKEFVAAWVRRVHTTGGNVTSDTECRQLVSTRERQLKRTHSRFTNSRALDQWGGNAGTRQMAYRWPNVRVLLEDLHAGLNREGNVKS